MTTALTASEVVYQTFESKTLAQDYVYKARGIVVPFYINTGDHDRFDIAYFAAVFYQVLREHQPDYTEPRILTVIIICGLGSHHRQRNGVYVRVPYDTKIELVENYDYQSELAAGIFPLVN